VQETVYNLFVIVDGGFVRSLGVASHVCSGSDGAKLALLQERVGSDFRSARTFPVPARYKTATTDAERRKVVSGTITFERYMTLSSDGNQLDIFEEVFRAIGAPPDPLVCITPVVDGVPRADGVASFGIGPLT